MFGNYIYAIMYLIFTSIQKIFLKQNEVNLYIVNLISILVVFGVIVVKRYNENKLNTLISKKWFSKDALILSSIGTFQTLTMTYCLRKLPISLTVPVGASWVIFALLFENLMLDYEITTEIILIMCLFMFGICVVNYHHLKVIDRGVNLMVLLILIISILLKGYYTTYIKKITNKYDTDDKILLDFSYISIGISLGLCLFNVNDIRKSNFSFKSIFIVGTVLLICNNIKQYGRFKSLELISENEWNLISSMILIPILILSRIIFKEKIKINQIIGIIILCVSFYLLYNMNEKSGKLI